MTSWLLIKRLIHLHKGKVVFSSNKKGQISIILLFPIILKSFTKLPELIPGTSLFRTLSVDKNHSMDKTYSSVQRVFAPECLVSNQSNDKNTILLVEENEELRSFLIQVLSEEHNVYALSVAESACETIRKEQPAVILLAKNFTNITGEELCLQIKSDAKTVHIPIILLKDPMNMGNDIYRIADCCLTLPLDISRLRAEVDNLIFNRGILRRRYIKLALGAEDMLGPGIENSLPGEEQSFIGRARKLIEENLANSDFNVDMLSAAMNMSRSGFYTKIKAVTNQAPADYIRTVKLNRALILLISRKYTVTEVAELTGFSDPKYFREVFKKYYGESPKKFVDSL